ncbi:MAG: GNAT family N-acetyltransferase [Sporichthyaceae bacterium]
MEDVTLEDGARISIRPVRASDGPLLAEAFERMSEASRIARFLVGKRSLSIGELHYLTDLDHHRHEALGALDPLDGRGIGIARYIRPAPGAPSAEVAIAVLDEWQHRGVGNELMTRLILRARAEGIRTFTATVAPGNRAVVGLLGRHGSLGLVHSDRYGVEYELSLDPAPAGEGPSLSSSPDARRSERPRSASRRSSSETTSRI